MTDNQVQLSLGGWVALTAASLILCVVVPFWIGLPSPTALEPAVVIALMLTAAASVRLAILIGSGEPRFAELMFWTFVYVWAGLAPVSQMTVQRLYWPGNYTTDDRFAAMALTALGIFAWWVGYRLASRGPDRKSHRDLSRHRVLVLGVIGSALTMAGIAKLGLSAFFTSRDASSTALAELSGDTGIAGGQLLRAAVSIPAMVATFLLLWSRKRNGWRLHGGSRVLLVLLATAMIVVANPLSNPRFVFAAVAFAVFVAAVRLDSKRRVRLVAIGLVAGTLFVFPIADAFRYQSEVGGLGLQFNAELLRHGDYDTFQQTMNGVRYVEDVGHTLGSQVLGLALFWVPRQIWDGKPEPTGSIVAAHAGYGFTNLSSPMWLEGFMDFGLVGTILMGLVLGALAGRLDRSFVRRETGLIACLAPIYTGYQVILLRGSLMAVIGFLTLWIFFTWLCSKRRETVEAIA